MSYGVCVHFSLPPSYLFCTVALFVHVWCMVLMSGGGSTDRALLNRVESKAFCLINSPLLTDCLDSLSHRPNAASLSLFDPMLHLYLFSTAIFMLTALLNLLTACLHPSRSLAAQGFLLLIPILYIFLMQELTSIFTLSSLTLVNSGTLFRCLVIHLPLT